MRTTLLIASLAVILAGAASAQTIFADPFDNNGAGWTLDTEWQIGAATASTGGTGNPDPGMDAQGVPGGGVAGVVIGGNASTALHAPYYLTSTAIDTTVIPFPNVSFQRWLNSDYTPFMNNYVDVYDGTTWVNIWQSGPSPAIQDASWTLQQFDLTPYSNPLLQVRIGFDITSTGVFTVSGWNVDDFTIFDSTPPANDVGVISIDAPGDPNVSGPQTVTVTIQNFGAATQLSIPVAYDVDMGTPVNETYVGSIAPGGTDTYSFTTQASLAEGQHTITAYTILGGDTDPNNDGSSITAQTWDYPYPGTPMGDLDLGTGVNAAPTSGFGNYTKTATALDTINLSMVSPMGTFDLQPFVLLTQPFTTGTPPTPTIPGLVHLDLAQPFVILINIDPFLTQFLNPGGTPYSFVMPAGFAGSSFLFQGACVTPALSLTDGYELQVQ